MSHQGLAFPPGRSQNPHQERVVSASARDHGRGSLAVLRFKVPIVEVDSTFYAIPNEKTAQLWVERTPKDFTFNAKGACAAHAAPDAARELAQRPARELGDSLAIFISRTWPPKTRRASGIVSRGLQPLRDAGKLGAVVFQFPKWFLPSPASYRFMEDLREWLPGHSVSRSSSARPYG